MDSIMSRLAGENASSNYTTAGEKDVAVFKNISEIRDECKGTVFLWFDLGKLEEAFSGRLSKLNDVAGFKLALLNWLEV